MGHGFEPFIKILTSIFIRAFLTIETPFSRSPGETDRHEYIKTHITTDIDGSPFQVIMSTLVDIEFEGQVG